MADSNSLRNIDKKYYIVAVLFIIIIVLMVPVFVPSLQPDSDKPTTTAAPVEKTTEEEKTTKEPTSEKEEPTKEEEENKEFGFDPVNFDTDEAYAENYEYCMGINRQLSVITIYEKDEDGKYTVPVKAMLCSCGKSGTDDTPAGSFKLGDRIRWQSFRNGTYGQYCTRVTGSIWIQSLPYTSQSVSSMKAEEFNKLGSNVTLGCIRVTAADAKWIYDNLPEGTITVIYDSNDPGAMGAPEPIKFDASSENRGWDPTDPDSNNPWASSATT